MSIANKVSDFLETVPALCHGVGNKESMCSIAAINLALYGKLTDDIPECMSEVIGKWIIPVQDKMPLDMLNSAEWRMVLSQAAGTGREHEWDRIGIILDWMWEVVLPQVQPVADANGFGDEWRRMCGKRTEAAAKAASEAAAKVAAWAAWAAARSAARAAWADVWDTALIARAAEVENFWTAVDPIGLLNRLNAVGRLDDD